MKEVHGAAETVPASRVEGLGRPIRPDVGLVSELFEEKGLYTHLRDHFFRETLVCVSDTDRAQGRAGHPVLKEKKRLAKVDTQRRAAERRLQASHPSTPNRAEDSRPRGSESTIGSDSGPRGSAPTSSEPIGSGPNYYAKKPVRS